MRRVLAMLLIAILATMPLVGMTKHASADAQDMQEMPCHESAPKPDADSKGDCDSCKGASHCCATCIPPAPTLSPYVDVGAIRISGVQHIAAGLVVTPLDPPPLAR
jgi:hypothetical protein